MSRPWDFSKEKFYERFMVFCALATSNTEDDGVISCMIYIITLPVVAEE